MQKGSDSVMKASGSWTVALLNLNYAHKSPISTRMCNYIFVA